MLQTAEPVVENAEGLSGADLRDSDDVFHSGKIYCANCIQCKLIPAIPEGEERYVLRVRCAAGKWKKKMGQEKMYKYCTITRRYLDQCDAYEEMGDTREFIRELRKTLPNRDEFYLPLENSGEEE